jgi:hypothetical protein
MAQRPRKFRVVTNAESPKLPPDEGARPILTPAQCRMLIAYAVEAEARARDPDVVPVDLARVWRPRRRR